MNNYFGQNHVLLFEEDLDLIGESSETDRFIPPIKSADEPGIHRTENQTGLRRSPPHSSGLTSKPMPELSRKSVRSKLK